MSNKLTVEKLDQYLKTNGKYYQKFLDKFNTKNGLFYSFNLCAFLFAPAWVAYRKLWLVYGLLFMFQIIIIAFFFMARIETIPPYLDVILKLLILLVIMNSIRVLLISNGLVLRKALNAKKNEVDKSSWIVVFLATIIFCLPISGVIFKNYYHKYIDYRHNISIHKAGKKNAVEFRFGNNHRKDGLLSGISKHSKKPVYFESQSFLSNKQIEKAFFTNNSGSNTIVIELTGEGKMLFHKELEQKEDSLIVILFDSQPQLAFKSQGMDPNSPYISLSITNMTSLYELMTYLNGQTNLQNEHTNFLSWLFNNI